MRHGQLLCGHPSWHCWHRGEVYGLEMERSAKDSQTFYNEFEAVRVEGFFLNFESLNYDACPVPYRELIPGKGWRGGFIENACYWGTWISNIREILELEENSAVLKKLKKFAKFDARKIFKKHFKIILGKFKKKF